MEPNPILQWIESDETLQDMIARIDATGKSIEEQAADAFHQLSEHYNLPKYPENITQEHYDLFESMGIDESRSVFEELALFKYLNPDDDPRGMVMAALYSVKNGFFTEISECAHKFFGSKKAIPKEYALCFIGNDISGHIRFLQPEESWVDLGARSMMKVTDY